MSPAPARDLEAAHLPAEGQNRTLLLAPRPSRFWIVELVAVALTIVSFVQMVVLAFFGDPFAAALGPVRERVAVLAIPVTGLAVASICLVRRGVLAWMAASRG